MASVVIPAHDEEATIASTLAALAEGPQEVDRLEVVVVCNGCRDATADIARAAGADVLEIDAASKIAALRAADRHVSSFPRIYLDGDVRLSGAAALDLAAAASEPGVGVAGVRPLIDTSGSSRPARWYYDFRERLAVFQHGVIGAGVYVLSAEGRARFGEWPDVLGDDQFVFRLFDGSERVTVPGHHTTVTAPPDLRTIVRRQVRVRQGNRQLNDGAGEQPLPAPAAGIGSALRACIAHPRRWPGMLTWLATNLLIRALTVLRPGAGDWHSARLEQREPRVRP